MITKLTLVAFEIVKRILSLLLHRVIRKQQVTFPYGSNHRLRVKVFPHVKPFRRML